MKSFVMYLSMTLAMGMISQTAIAQCKAMKTETTSCSAKAAPAATVVSANVEAVETPQCNAKKASSFQLVFDAKTKENAKCAPICPPGCIVTQCLPAGEKHAAVKAKKESALALKE